MSDRLTQAIALGLTTAIAVPIHPAAQAQTQAIPAAVAACYANPAVCAVVVAGAGTWILYRNGAKLICTWGGCSSFQQRTQEQRMIDDPDAHQEIVSDYIWATDDYDAQRKCQNMAQRWGNRYSHVQRANNWTNQAGKRRYTCFMIAEGEPKYGDRRR